MGRWDRHASGHRQVRESVEISAVAAEASAGSITDLDTSRSVEFLYASAQAIDFRWSACSRASNSPVFADCNTA